MDINSVIDSVMQFYSRLSYQTGLKSWQLLAIALGVLFILILLLGYLRKTRLKRVHVIQSTNRSEIIGINLSGRTASRLPQREYRNRTREAAFVPEETEEQKSWGQTTKDWRKLREKIRHLQHDISKYEKSEKHLKKQITELVNTNEKLQEEISRRDKVGEGLKQQINGLTEAEPDQKQEPSVEERLYRENEDQLTETQTSRETPQKMQDKTEKIENLYSPVQEISQQKQVEPARSIVGEKTEEEPALSTQTNQETEQITTVSSEQTKTVDETLPRTIESKYHPVEKTQEEELEQTDTAQRDHSVPLDIKELKAIADLAKRLQARGQQRQNQ
jgi:hypothetical protein